jgi:serine/threonine-protein kinase
VRSDVYSVGVSLYEMVTGQRPFQATSDYSIMAAHVKETPKPPVELQPALPAALNEIILMSIAKDPAQRFQTAEAFRNALSGVAIAASPSPAAISSSNAATVDAILPPAPITPAPRSLSSVATASTAAKAAAAPATPSIPIPPPQPASHRGLYMTLGALIVLVVVVAAGIYIPRRSKTQAHTPPSQPPPAAQSMAPSSPETATPTAPAPATADQNSSSQQTDAPAMTSAAEAAKTALSNAAPAPAGAPAAQPRKLGGKSSGKAPAVAAAFREPDKKTQPDTAPADPGTAANSAANLEEVEHEVDQLSSRAAAVDASLDRLQQEQNNAGFGLRGDMVAREASMKNNLAKAQNAVDRGDAQKAKKYEGLAQSDVEALEHFLKP